MLLEKFSRYFRLYDLSLHPRKSKASFLPLKDAGALPSVQSALVQRIKDEKAYEIQPNGDTVELIQVEYAVGSLVLLFHRASPDAADPMYRKKAAAAGGKKITLRQSEHGLDEEQSVSAHLLIYDKPRKPGLYKAALEEIPGLNMSVIRRIVAAALLAYPYESLKDGKKIETYTVFRADGVKSESLTEALKKGSIGYVTLSKQAKPKFVDGDFQPMLETMKLRIKGEITSDNWMEKFARLVKLGKGEGWEDFSVDLKLDDERSRTVRIDREEEAQEILFVRSELVAFKNELKTCTESIHKETVANALKLASS